MPKFSSKFRGSENEAANDAQPAALVPRALPGSERLGPTVRRDVEAAPDQRGRRSDSPSAAPVKGISARSPTMRNTHGIVELINILAARLAES